MAIIEIKNLTKYYGKIKGIENLSLSLKEGEVFGLIGPNGAGKSTTIRLIMNVLNKDAGSVIINGKEFLKNDLEIKKIIGYLPSEVYLYDDLTVKEMLDYHESFYDENLKSRRNELVKLLDIDETKKVEDLSLGNKKKIGIVLALMHNPKILVLDEPTSGLDPIMQSVFYDLLIKEKEKGTTILYSTHILSEVSKLCDRVGIVKDGNLLDVELVSALKRKNFTYVTVESEDIKDIISDLNVDANYESENTIKFKNTLSYNELVKKLSKYNIERLLIEEASIEDIFLHYYK